MDLTAALLSLDHKNDEHWTSDGLPRMDVVSKLTGGDITRQAVTDLAPDFNREVAKSMSEDAATREAAGDTTPDPVQEAAATDAAPDPEEVVPAAEEADQAGEDEPKEDDDTIDVFALPVGEVLASPELTALASDELDVLIDEAHARKAEADETVRQLCAKGEALKRATIQHERNRPGHRKTSGVQAFLASQAEARAKRAQAAQRFIDAGTTPADVADAIRGGSKLDQVMGQRGRGHGSQRPAPRNLAGR